MYTFEDKSRRLIKKWLYELKNEVVAEIILNDKVIIIKDTLHDEKQNESSACKPSFFVVKDYMIHTHPKICYLRNGVKYGWPSGQDIYTFLEHHLPIHFVVALEGLYTIHRGERTHKWHKLHKDNKKNIIEKHDLPADVGSIPQFLQHINNMKWVVITFCLHGIKE